jgi:CheY-like chemotaxis protein
VREAHNGEEAVAEWESWSPHLIWMDMRMPVMDGATATKTIRAREQERSEAGIGPTCIIALTASAFEHERDQYLSIGCDDFVAKPFQANLIFEKISQHLGIEFVYEDESLGTESAALGETVTRERLESVAPEKRQALARAVTVGDIVEAQRAVVAIGSEDESLAAEIRALVQAYRFDEIIDALEP